MTSDRIVEEVRAVREQIALENNNDLAAIFAALRKAEAESAQPHVTLPPRKVEHRRVSNS
jgi:hypothetical protein